VSAHDELLARNKCPCKDCKEWRTRRARKAGRARAATGDMRTTGARGQNGLLDNYRKEVRRVASARGIVLTDAEVTKRAELLRNNHLVSIQEERWRQEKAS
jgi:hypothetical protein